MVTTVRVQVNLMGFREVPRDPLVFPSGRPLGSFGFSRVPMGNPLELQVDQLEPCEIPRDTMGSPRKYIAPAGNRGNPIGFPGDLVVDPSISRGGFPCVSHCIPEKRERLPAGTHGISGCPADIPEERDRHPSGIYGTP